MTTLIAKKIKKFLSESVYFRIVSVYRGRKSHNGVENVFFIYRRFFGGLLR